MLGVLQPLFGALVILTIAVAFSTNRRAINWTTVACGLGLQVVVGHPGLDSAEAERILLRHASAVTGAELELVPLQA